MKLLNPNINIRFLKPTEKVSKNIFVFSLEFLHNNVLKNSSTVKYFSIYYRYTYPALASNVEPWLGTLKEGNQVTKPFNQEN